VRGSLAALWQQFRDGPVPRAATCLPSIVLGLHWCLHVSCTNAPLPPRLPSAGNDYMNAIAPMTALIPYMVAPGNHGAYTSAGGAERLYHAETRPAVLLLFFADGCACACVLSIALRSPVRVARSAGVVLLLFAEAADSAASASPMPDCVTLRAQRPIASHGEPQPRLIQHSCHSALPPPLLAAEHALNFTVREPRDRRQRRGGACGCL
jgi:hypothetical protein